MVSKFVTDSNLPDTATFDGPPGASPDPDTFRVEILNLETGLSPQIKLEVLRGGASQYTHTFDTVEGAVAGDPVYRTNEHIRLVSNAVDDGHRAHQTPLVKLGDTVRASLVGESSVNVELEVGRPPSENGAKAIRTVDINFVTLQGVSSDPGKTIERMSEDWAQVAIRYNLKSSETVTPVNNVLTIEGTATGAGQLKVDVTGSNAEPSLVQATVDVAMNDTPAVMAQNLANAINAGAGTGIQASHHRHNTLYIVMVNRGEGGVTFDNISNTAAGVTFEEPALDFTDDISLLEASVLGLNFKDDDDSSIDMIGVGQISVLGASRAATGYDGLKTNLPGWWNTSILREETIDTSDAGFPFSAGHEMGHALFDGGNGIHSGVATNLFVGGGTSVNDTIGASKRLTAAQNTTARTKSGPGTVPPLLQKK